MISLTPELRIVGYTEWVCLATVAVIGMVIWLFLRRRTGGSPRKESPREPRSGDPP